MLRARTLALVTSLAAIGLSGCGGETTKTTTVSVAQNENGEFVITEREGGPSEGGKSEAEQQDVEAQSAARLAHTLLETFYIDHQTYEGADVKTLNAMEPVMAKGAGATLELDSLSATGFRLTVHSESGTAFVIAKADDGFVTRECSGPGSGRCGSSGSW
jgi:hypothetical protein